MMSPESTVAMVLARDLFDEVAELMTAWMERNHAKAPPGVFPAAMLLACTKLAAHIEGTRAMIVLEIAKTDEERAQLSAIVGLLQAADEATSKRIVSKVLSEPRRAPPSSESAGTSTATPPG